MCNQVSIATRDDVIACYRSILGRDPESEDVIDLRVGRDLWTVVHEISHSVEHSTKLGRQSCHSFGKFSRSGYLAKSLSSELRASALIYNYSALRESLRISHIIELYEAGLLALPKNPLCPDLSVKAHIYDGVIDEGEIALVVSLGLQRLAVCSFTFVNGPEMGIDRETVILISRIQGYSGRREQINFAQKSLGDITLQHLLIATLEGIASAMNIDVVLGVQARNQPSFEDSLAEHFLRAYDHFFESLGGTETVSGFYRYDLPRIEQPLTANSGHLSRKRARRAARRALSQQACSVWTSYLID